MRKLLIAAAALAALLIIAAGAWIFVVNSVEQPEYTVLRQDGAIEVRQYPSMVVAEVTRKGTRKEAVNAGFTPLARYIFARDRAGDTISMTAPVTQQHQEIAMTAPVTQVEGGDAAWKVHFIMPSEFTLETLPKPASEDVTLRELPPSTRAVIRFSGVATDELIAEKEDRLREWLKERGLTAAGSPVYAYYNDPFTPGPLRRNEVMMTLPEFGQ